MDPSDENLIRRYRAGESAAFEALADRYASPAVRFASHFTRDRHAAEDAAQDAFLKLVKVLRTGQFDPGRGRFAPFFFRMLRNISIDRLRSRQASVSMDLDFSASPERDAATPLEEAERRDRVRALLTHLPENERTAIMLREFEGFSYKEIAESLDTPLDTIKTWIFRARRGIQHAWLALEVKDDTL